MLSADDTNRLYHFLMDQRGLCMDSIVSRTRTIRATLSSARVYHRMRSAHSDQGLMLCLFFQFGKIGLIQYLLKIQFNII